MVHICSLVPRIHMGEFYSKSGLCCQPALHTAQQKYTSARHFNLLVLRRPQSVGRVRGLSMSPLSLLSAPASDARRPPAPPPPPPPPPSRRRKSPSLGSPTAAPPAAVDVACVIKLLIGIASSDGRTTTEEVEREKGQLSGTKRKCNARATWCSTRRPERRTWQRRVSREICKYQGEISILDTGWRPSAERTVRSTSERAASYSAWGALILSCKAAKRLEEASARAGESRWMGGDL